MNGITHIKEAEKIVLCGSQTVRKKGGKKALSENGNPLILDAIAF